MPVHSEDDVLALIGEYFPEDHESLLLGRGDDCAVLRPGGPWAVTCDVFAEDAHFRRRYFSAADVGHKALAVNVSDVASSGARPAGFVVGLTLTGREGEDWLRGFASGMAALARRCGMVSAGGDLSRAATLNVCVTAWGELDAPGSDLRRGRARTGDVIFSVGPLGLARTGLAVLEAAADPEAVDEALRLWPASCGAHLRPDPLVGHGRALARAAAGAADRFSLMDVSDGLARDLPRLLASGRTGLGADVILPEAELPAEVRRYAANSGLEAPSFAFEGGEDYALLGTCPPERWEEVRAALAAVPDPCPEGEAPGAPRPPAEDFRVRRLGVVRPGGISLNGVPRHGGGFDHFARTASPGGHSPF